MFRCIVSLGMLMPCLCGLASGQDPFVVAGYLPQYRIAEVTSDRLNAVTDLIFFGLHVPTPMEAMDLSIDDEVLRKLQSFRNDHDCRILVCVGGWDRSKGFVDIVGNDASRKRFIRLLTTFCKDHGFDGVDFDWEHPRGKVQIDAYACLIQETKAAFADRGWLVTVAQAGWQDLGPNVYRSVDRVHLMAYDHDFPQATLEKAESDVDRLIGWGCPPEKLALGIPFYGRNSGRQARTYADLTAETEGEIVGDLRDGFAMNGPATVRRKVRFAKRRGLAGVMVWELAQDAEERERSLMSVIERQVEN